MKLRTFNKQALLRWLKRNGSVLKDDGRDMIVEVKPEKMERMIKTLAGREDEFRAVAVNGYFENDGSFILLYHFSNPYCILTLKCRMEEKPESMNSITNYFPEADAFEREFAEMFGIRMVDTRTSKEKEGLLLHDVKSPFHEKKVEKKDEHEIITSKSSRTSCLIPIGPQHPALLEPENFVLEVEDEVVLNAKINLGYVHRGIEKLAEQKNYLQDIFLIERICGICSGVHTVCYTACLERAAGIQAPERAEYIRTLVLELERIHSHMLWLGIFAYEMGQDTLFNYIFRDREMVLDRLEEISGNRINYGMSTIGGVRRDVNKEQLKRLRETARKIRNRAEHYLNIFSSDKSLLSRMENVGKISKLVAERFATGPNMRACGIKFDVRSDGYAAYDSISWSVVVEKGCDVLSSTLVRIKEIVESTRIIEEAASSMPEGKIKEKPLPAFRLEDVEQTNRTEAPRGELFYYIKGNGTDKPHRIKVRTPTLTNFQLLSFMLKNQHLADVPVIIASIDPCFSCCERVMVVDVRRDSKDVLTMDDLRRLSKDAR